MACHRGAVLSHKLGVAAARILDLVRVKYVRKRKNRNLKRMEPEPAVQTPGNPTLGLQGL